MSRVLYPALAIAAVAGVAVTFFLTRKTKLSSDVTPIERVIDLCSSAADKLDALAARAS